MLEAASHPYLVPYDGSFRIAKVTTRPPVGAPDKKKAKKRLAEATEQLSDLQRTLYADDRYAVLSIFQAMDAAGKDSTIRAVFSGVNPAGCQVFSFKKPSEEALDHDFLWRTNRRLPERGRLGVFNRSYYEEVLVVRVHPEILDDQKLPYRAAGDGLWQERFESICDHEKHLARNGTLVLKFWLNVSRDEQRRRFLSRLDEPHKHWKFSSRDVDERGFWHDYQVAYEDMLNATSRPWAPWYAVPADDKPYMRLTVARILVDTLTRLELQYPTVDVHDRARFAELRAVLEND